MTSTQSNSSPDVVVVGAGISGLAAARELQANGLKTLIVERDINVGGRMATLDFAGNRIDHGAQFFTVRSDEFSAIIQQATEAGAVTEWTKGFEDPPDGFSRWRGTRSMTDLCRWLATGLDIQFGTAINDLTEMPASAYVLTPPVPESMAILSFSELLPPPPLAIDLARIAYKPTITLMLLMDQPPRSVPDHGGLQFLDDPELAFVTDNQAKGLSDAPVLTIHLSNDLSTQLWTASDDEVIERIMTRIAPLVEHAAVKGNQIHRWRYAGPVEVWPEPTVVWGSGPVVALAGEAFAGPKVEGAYLSGVAAAQKVARTL